MTITFYFQDDEWMRDWICPPRVGETITADGVQYLVVDVSWGDMYAGAKKALHDNPCAAVTLDRGRTLDYGTKVPKP